MIRAFWFLCFWICLPCMIAAEGKKILKPLPYIQPQWDEAFYKKRYERKKPEDQRAKIAIVLVNVGLDGQLTQRILDLFPNNIALALTPYNTLKPSELSQIRRQKNNLLMVMPVEGYKRMESGQDPLRLRRTLEKKDIQSIMNKILNGAPAPVMGVINDQFSPALKNKNTIDAINEILKLKKLLLINTEMPIDDTFRHFANASGYAPLEMDFSVEGFIPFPKLQTLLEHVEELAMETGYASLALHANRMNINETLKWLSTLDLRKFEIITLQEFYKNVVVSS